MVNVIEKRILVAPGYHKRKDFYCYYILLGEVFYTLSIPLIKRIKANIKNRKKKQLFHKRILRLPLK